MFIANFILMDYGSGAIFGCPAHDQRDLDFANKYKLDVVPVILPEGTDQKNFKIKNEAYVGGGKLINSSFLNGVSIDKAKKIIVNKLIDLKIGNKIFTRIGLIGGLSNKTSTIIKIPTLGFGMKIN